LCNSVNTRGLEVLDPSAIRTTPTPAPFPTSASLSAALNVARPQRVGG
jgi:hypothetical protein